jgi:hypothetical protein
VGVEPSGRRARGRAAGARAAAERDCRGGRDGAGPPGGARDGGRGCSGKEKGEGEGKRERERGGELTKGIQIPVITFSKT